MATELHVKTPLTAQASPGQTPQRPASKSSWIGGSLEAPGETIKVPEGRPDVLVFVKTGDGYEKAMEIDRGGDSLFGTGPVATEFTEILAEAISQKLSITCKAAPSGNAVSAVQENVIYIREMLEEKKKQDEFAVTLLGIALAAAVIITIIFLIIGRIQSRGR